MGDTVLNLPGEDRFERLIYDALLFQDLALMQSRLCDVASNSEHAKRLPVWSVIGLGLHFENALLAILATYTIRRYEPFSGLDRFPRLGTQPFKIIRVNQL